MPNMVSSLTQSCNNLCIEVYPVQFAANSKTSMRGGNDSNLKSWLKKKKHYVEGDREPHSLLGKAKG